MSPPPIESTSATTNYHRTTVDGVGIFYREAGPKDAPTIVLLHGFPSSSREFDTLIPLLGAFTRPAAALMALYTLGTALIGHHYWTVKGADKVDSMEGFYKDLSIMGGFLLLSITGAGKYSIDALFSIAAR